VLGLAGTLKGYISVNFNVSMGAVPFSKWEQYARIIL